MSQTSGSDSKVRTTLNIDRNGPNIDIGDRPLSAQISAAPGPNIEKYRASYSRFLSIFVEFPRYFRYFSTVALCLPPKTVRAARAVNHRAAGLLVARALVVLAPKRVPDVICSGINFAWSASNVSPKIDHTLSGGHELGACVSTARSTLKNPGSSLAAARHQSFKLKVSTSLPAHLSKLVHCGKSWHMVKGRQRRHLYQLYTICTM